MYAIELPIYGKKVSKNENDKLEQSADQLEDDEIKIDTKQIKAFSCGICLNSYQEACPLGCHHFCLECLSSYLEFEICSWRVKEIRCPQSGCNLIFEPNVVQSLVSDMMFKYYRQILNRSLLQQDPLIYFCPNKVYCHHEQFCNEYIRYDGKGQLQCVCGQQICTLCRLELHPFMSCQSAFKIHHGLEQRDHRCPGCRAPIHKENGCNLMACTVCDYRFCWVCFGKTNHSDHYNFYTIFGCAVPNSQFQNIQPIRHALILRLLMIIPKLIAFLILMLVCTSLYPFSLFYVALTRTPWKFQWARKYTFKFYSMALIGIILLPITIPMSLLPASQFILDSLGVKFSFR